MRKTVCSCFVDACSRLVRPIGGLMLLWMSVVLAYGQGQDSLRMMALSNQALDLMYTYPDSALSLAQEALILAEQIEFAAGQAKILVNLGNIHYLKGQIFEARQYLRRAQAINVRIGDVQSQAAGFNSLAIISKRLSQFSEALTYYQQALALMKSHQLTRDAAYTRLNIGRLYQAQGALAEARPYFQASLRHLRQLKDPAGIAANLSAMADLAYTAGDTIEALRQYEACLAIHREQADRFGEMKMLHKLADLQGERREFAQAEAYLHTVLRLSRELGDRAGRCAALQSLARLKLKQGQPALAQPLAQVAYRLADSLGVPRERWHTAELAAEVAQTLGQWQAAAVLAQKALAYQDTVLTGERDQQAEELRIRYETERKERAIEALRAQNRTRRRINLLLGLVLTLLLLIGGLLVYYQRQAHRRRKLLLTRENELLKAQQAMATQSLAHTREKMALQEAQLTQAVRALQEKSQLVERLKHELPDLMSESQGRELSIAKLHQLLQQKILTEEDWQSFQQKFDQLFPTYRERLRQHYPHLTQGEVRLWLLTKLNLSGKAIADILGVSSHSVRMSRYRLKKKLDLDRHTDLTTFMQEHAF